VELGKLKNGFIPYYRWRGSFFIIGGIGVAFGLIGLLMIKEPKRGRFDIDVKHENPKLMAQK
jgi:predicted MFS family arabinose efflux permease